MALQEGFAIPKKDCTIATRQVGQKYGPVGPIIEYFIIEVPHRHPGANGVTINEIILRDNDGISVPYTTTSTDYSTTSDPRYWNDTIWDRTHLNNGSTLYGSATATFIWLASDSDVARFLIIPDNDAGNTVKTITFFTGGGSDRTASKLRVYGCAAADYDKTTMLVNGDFTNATLVWSDENIPLTGTVLETTGEISTFVAPPATGAVFTGYGPRNNIALYGQNGLTNTAYYTNSSNSGANWQALGAFVGAIGNQALYAEGQAIVGYEQWGSSNLTNQWLSVDMQQDVLVDGFSIVSHPDNSSSGPKDVTLQRSADGVTWVDVESVTTSWTNVFNAYNSVTYPVFTHQLSEPVGNRYYRLYMHNSHGGSGSMIVGEFELHYSGS